jgi:hypothetical protein
MAGQFNVVVVHGIQVGVQVLVAYSNPGQIQQAATNATVTVFLNKYGAARGRPPLQATPAGGNLFTVGSGDFSCGAAVFDTYTAALAFAVKWHAENMPQGS